MGENERPRADVDRDRNMTRVRSAITAAALFATFACTGQVAIAEPPAIDAGALAAEKAQLEAHVRALASDIGPRAIGHGDSMQRAEQYIADAFASAGWTVKRHAYAVPGGEAVNLEVERKGTRPDTFVVIGAHYDTVAGSPGADDNASGVAALLVLARAFAHSAPERTLRFVAFANEEPPWFRTEHMGSRVYARGCKQRGEFVVAMLSLESLGFYSRAEDSQSYPSDSTGAGRMTRGNYLAFISNPTSKNLLARISAAFAATQTIASDSAALPDSVDGVDWSDHRSFWEEGYPAVMATDTAPFRNPHYHRPGDTPETLDYDSFALAVRGLHAVVAELAGIEQPAPPGAVQEAPGVTAP
jgi:Zn-dependent M28 family amino/carboxypeptidase